MTPFVQKFGLRDADGERQCAELKARLEREAPRLIRLAWSDTHGHCRVKLVTLPVALAALEGGYNINVATTTLDASGARTFSSFTRGGGMGIAEMTGSPNITIVPDPATFRMLPWAPGIGWMLCDEYFNSGAVYPFSTRQLLKAQLRRLAARGQDLIVGLEVEWYLFRLAEEHLTFEHTGSPGVRGRPVGVWPIEPGYSYHSESNLDLMQPVLSGLGEAYEQIGLPVRSIENEWGPGQVECTFAPRTALAAADDLLLFRTATKQVCRRLGCVATFMSRPALKGFYSSGWHLHQSLVDREGQNLFMPQQDGEALSALAKNFLGGLLAHAGPSTVFATPTVNGYRRFRPNSLAPDRASWAVDHRGAMVRVLGAPGDPASRLENRVGEPAANPYLYIASQIVAGLDGVEHAADPGPPDDAPYAANRVALPQSLDASLDALEKSALFRAQLGEVFVEYFLKLKRNELGRFTRWLEDKGLSVGDEPTEWEQNEYFDYF